MRDRRSSSCCSGGGGGDLRTRRVPDERKAGGDGICKGKTRICDQSTQNSFHFFFKGEREEEEEKKDIKQFASSRIRIPRPILTFIVPVGGFFVASIATALIIVVVVVVVILLEPRWILQRTQTETDRETNATATTAD